MKTAIVNVNEICSGYQYRIKPNVFLVEGKLIFASLTKNMAICGCVKDIVEKIFRPGIFKRVFVLKNDHGLPYVTAQDMMANEPLASAKLLSIKKTDNIGPMILQDKTILVSCAGSIGNIRLIDKTFANTVGSQDIIRVVPKNNYGFLYSYLSTHQVYSFLQSKIYGSVVPRIEPENVGDIPLVKFSPVFQESVELLIQDSVRLREEANIALENATRYFDNKYPISSITTKVFRKNIKSMNFSWASYNNNQEVKKHVDSFIDQSFVLGEEAERVFSPPMFKHIYLNKDNGYPFLTGGELSQFNVRYYRWLSPRGVTNIDDYVVTEGTIFVYMSGSIDGMIGSTFIADKVLDKCCLSNHVMRIIIRDKNLSYWTFAYLHSHGGLMTLKSLATGTAIPNIVPERVASMRIPKPDQDYNYIAELVSKYIELNSLSKQKENQAISMVEAEIEKWNN